MAVVFADPFGSFEEGFIRGQTQRMRVEQHEYDAFDRFVFEPQQELAREQREFDRQLQLLNERSRLANRGRSETQSARRVDAGIQRQQEDQNYGFMGLGSASPAAAPRAQPRQIFAPVTASTPLTFGNLNRE